MRPELEQVHRLQDLQHGFTCTTQAGPCFRRFGFASEADNDPDPHGTEHRHCSEVDDDPRRSRLPNRRHDAIGFVLDIRVSMFCETAQRNDEELPWLVASRERSLMGHTRQPQFSRELTGQLKSQFVSADPQDVTVRQDCSLRDIGAIELRSILAAQILDEAKTVFADDSGVASTDRVFRQMNGTVAVTTKVKAAWAEHEVLERALTGQHPKNGHTVVI